MSSKLSYSYAYALHQIKRPLSLLVGSRVELSMIVQTVRAPINGTLAVALFIPGVSTAEHLVKIGILQLGLVISYG